jgi:hypothetical protein
MIFPERVFGKEGAICIRSGLAMGPISFVTNARSSYLVTLHGGNIRVNSLALYVVGEAYNGGFGDIRV